MAAGVGDRVIGLLVNNNKAKTIETLAVRTPRVGEKQHVAAIEDIAVLTGAEHPGDLMDRCRGGHGERQRRHR